MEYKRRRPSGPPRCLSREWPVYMLTLCLRVLCRSPHAALVHSQYIPSLIRIFIPLKRILLTLLLSHTNFTLLTLCLSLILFCFPITRGTLSTSYNFDI